MKKVEYIKRIRKILERLENNNLHSLSNQHFLKAYGDLTLIGEITNDYIHQVEKECKFND